MRYNIVFHPSWWHQNAGIDFSESFWNDPEVRIAADMKMRRVLYEHFGDYGLGEKNPEPRPLIGSDLLACGYLPSQLLGCKVVFSEDNAPQVLCAELSEDDAFAIPFPNFDENPVWQGIQRQLDWLQKEFGRVESYINLSGIQNLAMDLRGQNLFLDYYDDESPAEHLLDVSYFTIREMCRRLSSYTKCISGGVSNIVESILPDVLLHSNCSVEMISEQTYIDWLLPYEIKLAEEFPVYGIHHCGQTMEHVVKGYAKVPNLRLVEVGAFSELKDVVAALDPTVLINARYSPVRLKEASNAELYTELAEMKKILPEERLSISCVGIDASVPDERIVQFCAYCKELLREAL